MKIYNESKTKELTKVDTEKGYLIHDTITYIEPEVLGIEEQGHYETVKEYENGGKDVQWVVDVVGQQHIPEHEVTENILVYIPYTKKELQEHKKDQLRIQREAECFPIINRGKLWYDSLSAEQLIELQEWYENWLNVTESMEIPTAPNWLK